jgi:hypothetical protein
VVSSHRAGYWDYWQRGPDGFRIERGAFLVDKGPVKLLGLLCAHGGRDVAVDVLTRNEILRPDGSVIPMLAMLPPPATKPRRHLIGYAAIRAP